MTSSRELLVKRLVSHPIPRSRPFLPAKFKRLFALFSLVNCPSTQSLRAPRVLPSSLPPNPANRCPWPSVVYSIYCFCCSCTSVPRLCTLAILSYEFRSLTSELPNLYAGDPETAVRVPSPGASLNFNYSATKLDFMTSSLVQAWLREAIAPYTYRDQAFADVNDVLSRYSTLRPKTDVYTFDDGRMQLLVCIYGTIPISFRSSSYNIPIAYWLPFEYPKQPAIPYVTPTSDMLVRKSEDVDLSGRCSTMYLRNWERKSEGCSLRGLIEDMQEIFARAPPVYAKPKSAAPAAATVASPSTSSSPTTVTSAPAPAPGPPPRPPPPPGVPGQLPLRSYRPSPSPSIAPPAPTPLQGPPGRPALPVKSDDIRVSSSVFSQAATPPVFLNNTSLLATRPPPPVPPPGSDRPPPHPWSQQQLASQTQSQPISPLPPMQSPPVHLPPQSPPAPPTTFAAPYHYAPAHGPPLPPTLSQYVGGYTPSPPQLAQSPPPPPPPMMSPRVSAGPSQQVAAPPYNAIQQQHPSQPHSTLQQPPPAPAVPPPTQPRIPAPNFLDSDENETPGPSGVEPESAYGIATPARPPNPQLQQLHANVHQKFVFEMANFTRTLSDDAEKLRSMQSDVLTGEPAIRDEMARLVAVRDVCRAVAQRTRSVVELAEANVSELKRKGDPEVDELVCSTTIVYNQMINLVAEDNAIEDTIYHLHRALNAGRIDLDRFIRVTRVLAEEQFMKRALMEKIQAGLPLGASVNWS